MLSEKEAPFIQHGYENAVAVAAFVGKDYFCDSGIMVVIIYYFISSPMTLSEIIRGVIPIVPAASSTTLHGSVRPFPSMYWNTNEPFLCLTTNFNK